MIGRTIIRWLVASGRPTAPAQRDATISDVSTDTTADDEDVVATGNWITRTIQKNRTLTASGIAVVMFTYGGFAWSARPNTRLVRKAVDPIPDVGEDFDEFLNLPSYTEQGEQRLDAATVAHPVSDNGPHMSEPGDDSFGGDSLFDGMPQLDVPDNDHLQFSDNDVATDYEVSEPALLTPTTQQPPALSAPTAPEVSFPSLGLPDLSAPQLDDTFDQAEPLRDSSNPFQSQ